MDTSILPYEAGPVTIQGRIASVTPANKSVKIVLEHLQVPRLRADHVPSRVRLHINRQDFSLKAGQWIKTTAKLKPTPSPTHPRGYDFQRHMFFQKIGAIGFSFGNIQILEEAPPSPTTFFDRLRVSIQDTVKQTLANSQQQALAIALLTGNKAVLDEETKETVRVAGLAHLLAISGLHIGLVCSITFISFRFLLALSPKLTLRYAIKKWAAVLSIVTTLFFTLLTGASVPTMRAFMMTCIFLVGILLDRRAISLRSVAWAAIAILLIFPESLMGASFQLSFAAVIALVAFYENLQHRTTSTPPLKRYIMGVLSTSAIASLATMPYAAALFNRIAVYGLGANLLAIPLTVFWIMPLGMLSLILMPLGLHHFPLTAMGWGISGLVWVSDFFAQLPNAHLAIPHIPTSAVILVTLGALLFLLTKLKVRILPTCAILIATCITIYTPQPDLLISKTADLQALRTDNGEIFVSNMRKAQYIRDKWVAQWGQDENVVKTMADNIPCDQNGCLYRHKNQTTLIINTQNLALGEDCQRADILITPQADPLNCIGPQQLITAYDLAHKGAHALYFKDSEVIIDTVRQQRGQRPWTVYRQ